MAQLRECRVVLWDLHGAFVEIKVDPPSLGPLLGKQHWANCARATLEEAGASFLQLNQDHLDPVTFWRKRMMLELTTPRNLHGKIIPERRFQEMVNTELLKLVASEFMSRLDKRTHIALARTLKRKRRRDNERHTLYSDMRETAHWLVNDMGIMLYMLTAQSRHRTNQLLARCNAPRSLFLKVYPSVEVGLPKSHPDFWKTVQERVCPDSSQVVCIEDNLAMGASVLQSGLGLILADRDGATARFIREDLRGRLGGVELLQIGDPLPGQGPFVVCARGPREIQRCIQAMRYVPTPEEA